MYSRMRRMIGRQKLSSVRPWITVCVFPVLLLFLLLGSRSHGGNALALVAGAGSGVALGIYGLRVTRFEQTSSGLFYTPNAHLGIALSLLLLARVAYRAVQLYLLPGPMVAPAPAAFLRSPLTLALSGALVGYYIAYAAGLLRWRRRVAASDALASVEQTGT